MTSVSILFKLGFFKHMKQLPSISNQIDEDKIFKIISKNFSKIGPYWFELISSWLIRSYSVFQDIDKFIILIYFINKDLIFFRKNGLIIDYDTFEQVLEYHGKVQPDIAAQLVDQYGRMYNALSTFDITGGMGIAATSKLKEIGYPKNLLHYDNVGESNIFWMPPPDAIPGINFASKNRRGQIIAALEEAVARGGFKIRSERLVAELKKFIYKNGRPDHMKGSHDDLIMALGMCLFVANTSFKKLQESDNMTKAMLDSWKVNNHVPENKTQYLLDNDTISSSVTPNKTYNNPKELLSNNNNLQNTRDFSWLFGNINKR